MALDLPPRARAALARWRDALIAARSDLRAVPEGHLHVTVAFLGWQDEGGVEAIAGAVRDTARGLAPAALVPGAVRGVPPRRPRLFALELGDQDGRAASAHAAVSSALEELGVYRPERRPFWPHITLIRARGRERRVSPLPAGPPPPGQPFTAAALTLYRSTPRPEGALYEPLTRSRVGKAGVA